MAHAPVYDDEDTKNDADNPGWYRPDEPQNKAGGRSKKRRSEAESGDELENREDSGADTEAGGAENDELNALGARNEGSENDDEPSLYNPKADKKSGKGYPGFGTGQTQTRRYKRALFIGTPIGLVLIALVMLAAIFFGSLKSVHFATVLRSSGFATFQLSMRRFWSQVEFDKTVLTEDSTGSLERPSSNLLEKLRITKSPERIFKELGRENSLKFITENGNVRGFEINGERVSYDDIAQANFGKNMDELNGLSNVRERMTIRKAVVDRINLDFSDRLGDSRFYRNSFWKGFREFTGIRMNWPLQKIRELAGKKPLESESSFRQNEETYTAEGNTKATSALDQVEEAADAEANTVKTTTKLGERLRSPEIFNKALDSIGIKPADFRDGLNKASTPVLVGTLYCIAHDLAQTGPRINENLEMQAARYGHDQQTIKEQIQDGKNVNAEFVSASNADWDGVKKNGQTVVPPAEVSPYYLADTNQSQSKGDLDSLKNAPSVHLDLPTDQLGYLDDIVKAFLTAGTSPILTNIPGIGSGIDSALNSFIDYSCNALLNPFVQGGFVLAEVFAAGSSGGLEAVAASMFKAIVFFGGGAALGQVLEDYIHNLAGTGFSGASSGSDKFTESAIATDYLDSRSNQGVAYGRPMSGDEAAATKTAALEENRKIFQESPWQDRYFAIDNPYSLVGTLSVQMPYSFANLTTKAVAAFTALPRVVASFVSGQLNGNLFVHLFAVGQQQTAFAAEGIDFQKKADFFGVQQWGWTPAETNRVETDPDFSLENNAAWVEQYDQQHPGWSDALKKCYNPDTLLTNLPGNCTQSRLQQDDALHWRLYQVHSVVIDDMSQDVGKDNGL